VRDIGRRKKKKQSGKVTEGETKRRETERSHRGERQRGRARKETEWEDIGEERQEGRD
jgi:hypothetical protein